LDDAGERITLEVKVGDRVLYARYSGTEIKLDDKKVLIFRETDILAVVES
jgi:chaperonin GroES